MTTLLEHLREPERHCTCGHHEGSHCHGFSNQSCMWCDCRAFDDPVASGDPAMARPSDSRRYLSRR